MYFNDIRYKRALVSLRLRTTGLITVVHGRDPKCRKTSCIDGAGVIRGGEPENMVLARIWGAMRCGMTLEETSGRSRRLLYFGRGTWQIPADEQFVRIVRAHGADKILFAAAPMGDEEFIELLSLPCLFWRRKKRIRYLQNACSLLANIAKGVYENGPVIRDDGLRLILGFDGVFFYVANIGFTTRQTVRICCQLLLFNNVLLITTSGKRRLKKAGFEMVLGGTGLGSLFNNNLACGDGQEASLSVWQWSFFIRLRSLS